MDLNNLRDSLDAEHSASASSRANQQLLLRDFKSAALHLTTLYRQSLTSSKDSFREGYQAALNDVLGTLGERRRLTGHGSGSNNTSDSSTAEGTAQAQLQWLERYLKGRSEAISIEDAEEDAAACAVAGADPPNPPSSSAATPARPELRAQLSDASTRTPTHGMRLRMRQQSEAVADNSIRSAEAGKAINESPAAFTFRADRMPSAAAAGFSSFSHPGHHTSISMSSTETTTSKKVLASTPSASMPTETSDGHQQQQSRSRTDRRRPASETELPSDHTPGKRQKTTALQAKLDGRRRRERER